MQGALFSPEYSQDFDFAARQMAQHIAMVGGTPKGLPNQHIRETYFDGGRPSQGHGSVVPVSIDQTGHAVDLHNRREDPTAGTRAWMTQAFVDQALVGDQRLLQMQPHTAVARNRATCKAFTRELHHPLTGESTNVINFSYMPSYPTVTQQRIALHKAQNMGADTQRRNVDNYTYWRNPHQSFRYEEEH